MPDTDSDVLFSSVQVKERQVLPVGTVLYIPSSPRMRNKHRDGVLLPASHSGGTQTRAPASAEGQAHEAPRPREGKREQAQVMEHQAWLKQHLLYEVRTSPRTLGTGCGLQASRQATPRRVHSLGVAAPLLTTSKQVRQSRPPCGTRCGISPVSSV